LDKNNIHDLEYKDFVLQDIQNTEISYVKKHIRISSEEIVKKYIKSYGGGRNMRGCDVSPAKDIDR